MYEILNFDIYEKELNLYLQKFLKVNLNFLFSPALI